MPKNPKKSATKKDYFVTLVPHGTTSLRDIFSTTDKPSLTVLRQDFFLAIFLLPTAGWIFDPATVELIQSLLDSGS